MPIGYNPSDKLDAIIALLEDLKLAIFDIQAAASTAKPADEALPFTDKALAVADTAEDLVTVPVGKRVRSITLRNAGNDTVHVEFGAAATTTSLRVPPKSVLVQDDLDAASVSWIGGAGQTPTVSGYVLVGPE